jgi:WXG100 family type VII secretion target
MQEIDASFESLGELAKTVNRTGSRMEELLDDLSRQLRRLTELWEGAASAGFQETLGRWFASADDLRGALHRLEGIVNTTHANYRSALVTNSGMWPAR